MKLFVGILIGLIVALGVGFFAYKSGYTPLEYKPFGNFNRQLETSKPITNNQPTTSTLPAGQEKISGTFSIYTNGLIPDVVFFNTTVGTAAIPKDTFFAFANQTEARTALRIDEAGKLGQPGCDYISGKAEITISNFAKPTTLGDSPSGAKLVTVNKITQEAQCGRGNPTN